MAAKKRTDLPVDEPKPEFSFRLRADAVDDDGEAIDRINVGSDPQVALSTGETFTTDNERVARALRRDPHLEDVTK